MLTVGTKVEACGKTWTVQRVGRVYYHMTVDGNRSLQRCTFEIPKHEAHADIQSGKAKVVT